MRMVTLAVFLSAVPLTAAAAEPRARERRAADDLAEMREAISMLTAIVEAASRPAAPDADAPRLLQESLRTGQADPEAMGAIIRWVLREREEKVASVFADALVAADPHLSGAQGEQWNDAARSIIGAFQGVLRDAAQNRRRHGDDLLRELKPAIDAAASALKQVQEQTPDPTVPEK
jgi:hypothetical protein